MTQDNAKRLATAVRDASLTDAPSAQPRIDRTTQGRIGDQLRAMYDDLVHQPVPDRFRDLLDRLEQGVTPERVR